VATDTFGRTVDYLRISVTDRCNLRCVYCMPAEGVKWRTAPRSSLSTKSSASLRSLRPRDARIRLTGGEPLVRPGIADLVRRLRAVPGIESVALTTNGALLPRLARDLAGAGLDGVNISLVSLDPEVYSRVTRADALSMRWPA